MEDIIVRDFYPELPTLQEKTEYYEALKTNDLAKLREFQLKYGAGGRPSTICKYNVHNTDTIIVNTACMLCTNVYNIVLKRCFSWKTQVRVVGGQCFAVNVGVLNVNTNK